MKTVSVNTLTIGQGRPEIAVSLIARDAPGILAQARAAVAGSADLIEWRLDWFESREQQDKVCALLDELEKVLEGKPLLVTVRTTEEGGQAEVDEAGYARLYEPVLTHPVAAMIDLEWFSHPVSAAALNLKAHQQGKVVIGSYHNFHHTPSGQEMVDRLAMMARGGADVVKLAVMPQNREDVWTLLEATRTACRKLDVPVVTMSMGASGVFTRLAGELSGSAITFAALEQASAPGQIELEALKGLLDLLHIPSCADQ